MKIRLIILFLAFQPVWLFSQNAGSQSAKFKLVTTAQVLQDLQQNGTASKYFETAQDLVYLDDNLAGALNAITPGSVTQENLDYIRYINSRDQKPYREVWDHNVYMKYAVTITAVQELLTNADALADLKKRLGREFYRLDPVVYINGTDRIMFILRGPSSEAGSFYRAILNGGSIRIDEISNWRDS
jgi:hypothetical protein